MDMNPPSMALLLSVDADAVRRVQRLQYAVSLLGVGKSHAEVSALLRTRYSVSRATSYRIASAAMDLAK